jgi:hypothetical protein
MVDDSTKLWIQMNQQKLFGDRGKMMLPTWNKPTEGRAIKVSRRAERMEIYYISNPNWEISEI